MAGPCRVCILPLRSQSFRVSAGPSRLSPLYCHCRFPCSTPSVGLPCTRACLPRLHDPLSPSSMAPALVDSLLRRWLHIEECDDSDTDESDWSRLKEEWYCASLPLLPPALPACSIPSRTAFLFPSPSLFASLSPFLPIPSLVFPFLDSPRSPRLDLLASISSVPSTFAEGFFYRHPALGFGFTHP